ncbi:MAG: MBL fold metallo-hydrolase [Arenibacterium sp.]
MTSQDGTHSFKVGDFKLTMISDGFFPMTADVWPTIDDTRFQATLADAGLAAGVYESAVNAFVLDTGSEVHLIDAGGGAMAPSLGKLPERLAAAGYSPDQIQSLIITHLHPDHIGAATDEAGAVFKNAEMVVSEADHGFWTNPDTRAAAPDEAKPFFDMAVGAVTAYDDRLRLISGEADIMTGVTAVPLPGHTPGHFGLALSSGGEDILIWSDIVHMQYLQFAEPEITIAFDIDPEQAVATRKKVLDQVATDNLRIAGMHLRHPGLGRVEKRASGGFHFTPE